MLLELIGFYTQVTFGEFRFYEKDMAMVEQCYVLNQDDIDRAKMCIWHQTVQFKYSLNPKPLDERRI